MAREIVVGTRASLLARTQTTQVISALESRFPRLVFRIQLVQTQGDRNQTTSLRELGGQGIFVREIETLLARGELDLAVHSMKDLPGGDRPGLTLVPVLPREDPRDAFVSRDHVGLLDLPPGARVGTGSARRIAQVRHLRPDLQLHDIRGNVDTRLRKLDAGDYDAIILAAAGLSRLALTDRVTEYLSVDQMIPAPGQGTLAAEVRADDAQLLELVRALVDPATEARTTAERAYLTRLGAGCTFPIAAHATVTADQSAVELHTLLARPDGQVARHCGRAPCSAAASLGATLAEQSLAWLEQSHVPS
jgi:hydroxymethylbilane synthase